jgi:hypothetical protein
VILDGASWHNSHGLVAPSNITLLALPQAIPFLRYFIRSLLIGRAPQPARHPGGRPGSNFPSGIASESA